MGCVQPRTEKIRVRLLRAARSVFNTPYNKEQFNMQHG